MNSLLVLLAAAVAVMAAIRSTWSPCGQSMLSTITPLAERTRGHRFWASAAWFVAGATAGGACLGLGAAALAALLGAVAIPASPTALAIAALLAAVAAASDARLFGFRLPFHCRQVNELWLNRYRPWVYAGGFGWQIGFGLATFIMTAGVYLMVALAVLTADPAVAFGTCVLFGAVRGLGVVPARRITSPRALNEFHRRFDALGPITRAAMLGGEVVVALAAAVGAWGAPGAVAGGLLFGLATAAVLATRLPFAARHRNA